MLHLSASNSPLEQVIRYRSGFKLPIADVEVFDCHWSSPLEATARLRNHNLFLSLSRPPKRSQIRRDWLDGQYTDLADCSLLPAQEVVRVRSEGGNQRLMLCRFSPEKFESTLGFEVQWDAPARLAAMDLSDPAIRATLARMSQEVLRPAMATPIMLEALSVSLIVELGRYLDRRLKFSERSPGHLAAWQMRRIADYASAHRGMPTLLEVATACRVSVRHLVRAFKATTGRTVVEYFFTRQMEQAEALLMDTELPMKAIAKSLGFSHPASFTVAFTRAHGETPTAYRSRSERLSVSPHDPIRLPGRRRPSI